MISISFCGKRIVCPREVSVAAALTFAGERALRRTSTGAVRGVFCGMGVCQDCLVSIDGTPNQCACMTIVRDGMTIETQGPYSRASTGCAIGEDVELAPDLLVIGGGPGGLAAAAIAAEHGLEVVLIDERPKLGGQFYKQPAQEHVDAKRLDRQFRDGKALIARTLGAGVRVLSNASVWAVSGPNEIKALGVDSAYTIRPKLLILATGAYERGLAVPGWTLPGVMTTGAAQTLLRSYDTVAGQRVLIAGNGPLNLQVAVELHRRGRAVVALAEASPRPRLAMALDIWRLATGAPDLVFDGIRYLATLRTARVPIFHRHAVVRLEGHMKVERAFIAEINRNGVAVADSEKSFEVDAVCLGYGFLPRNEIARAIGCTHAFDERQGQLVAERDELGRSSVAGVWVVGDCGGLGGARVAESMGILAGADCVRTLRKPVTASVDRAASATSSVLSRNRRFQRALWRIYQAPRLVDQLAKPDTLICRCEEVTLRSIEEAIGRDIAHIGGVKRITRAGMGRCQGRYCASLICEIAARSTGRAPDELSMFAPRVPFKPVSIVRMAPVQQRGLTAFPE